jgi:hypothetical protein
VVLWILIIEICGMRLVCEEAWDSDERHPKIFSTPLSIFRGTIVASLAKRLWDKLYLSFHTSGNFILSNSVLIRCLGSATEVTIPRTVERLRPRIHWR